MTNLQVAFSRNRLENRNDFYLKSILLYQLAHLQVRDGYVSVSWQHQPSGSRRVLAYRFFQELYGKQKNKQTRNPGVILQKSNMKTSVLWVSEQPSGLMAPSGTKPGVELPDKIQGILLNMNFLINYK